MRRDRGRDHRGDGRDGRRPAPAPSRPTGSGHRLPRGRGDDGAAARRAPPEPRRRRRDRPVRAEPAPATRRSDPGAAPLAARAAPACSWPRRSPRSSAWACGTSSSPTSGRTPPGDGRGAGGGRWTSLLSARAGDRRAAVGTTARTVATVVARDDEVQRRHQRPGGQRRRRPRPTCCGGWARARPTRSAPSTSTRSQMDAADRRLRARPDLDGFPQLRHQPRARSGGSAGADGDRRDRGGGQLSGQETVAAPDGRGRTRESRERAARPVRRGRRCAACASGSPTRGGAGGWPPRRSLNHGYRICVGDRRRPDRRPRPGHHPAARARLADRDRRPVRPGDRVPLGRAAARVHQEAREALDGLGRPSRPVWVRVLHRRWRRRPSSTASSW